MHLYPIQLELEKIDKTKVRIFDELRQQGVGVNLHYIPVHTHPYYQNMGFKTGDYPAAERYYSRAITIPMYQGLTSEEQDQVAAALKNVLT